MKETQNPSKRHARVVTKNRFREAFYSPRTPSADHGLYACQGRNRFRFRTRTKMRLRCGCKRISNLLTVHTCAVKALRHRWLTTAHVSSTKPSPSVTHEPGLQPPLQRDTLVSAVWRFSLHARKHFVGQKMFKNQRRNQHNLHMARSSQCD